MRLPAALIVMAFAVQAAAQEIPLPRERPSLPAVSVEAGDVASEATPPGEAAPVPMPRPRRRPAPEAADPAIDDEEAVPEIPPPRIYQAACPGLLLGRIEAETAPPIAEGQCVVRSPLAVTGLLVNGRVVPLAGSPTLTCGMAETLRDWAEAVDGYLAARENTRIARVLSGTSYACRPRNNAAGGDLSEHGFANALDVVGFELEDGRKMTLPGGWSEPLSSAGRLLRFAHGAGCARFTTTLGPEANALHADHLHLDLGCHGKTCTARLCE